MRRSTLGTDLVQPVTMGVDPARGLAWGEGRLGWRRAEPLSELAGTEREVHQVDRERLGRRQTDRSAETRIVEQGARHRRSLPPQRSRQAVLECDQGGGGESSTVF